MQVKNKLGRNAPALVLTLLLGLAPTLGLAEHGDYPPGPPDPERMLNHLTEQLDLSDQQRKDLAGVFAAHKEAVRADGDKMKAAWEALETQIHADAFDESAIRQASAGVAALQANRAVERGKLFQAIRGILTPDQLQKFQEMRQQHQDMMKERGGPMGGRHHGPSF
jgi:Spy/CpxP family protein refolding chaperone